jgi:hypothetical protein
MSGEARAAPLNFPGRGGKIFVPPVVWWARGQPNERGLAMEDVRTQARLVDFNTSGFAAGGLATIVPRAEIADAAAQGEYPARLVLDVDRIEAARGSEVTDRARVTVDWDEATLKELLSSTADEEVALWFDPSELARAFDDSEVDAHGLRERAAVLAIAVAATGATAGAGLAGSNIVSDGATAASAGGSTPVAIVSDVANSDAVARQAASAAQPDALSRYEANVESGGTSATFASDVANSDAVSRYEANQESSGFASDVANSDAVSRYEANQASSGFASDVANSDAVSRYEANQQASSGFASDVANSDAVSRYEANVANDQPDALSRYQANVESGGTAATPSFASDVANSGAVARYEATSTPSTSGGGISMPSPGETAGIAAGVALLISAAGFGVARSRQRPARPA